MSELNENSCDTIQDALKEEQPSLEGNKNEKSAKNMGKYQCWVEWWNTLWDNLVLCMNKKNKQNEIA